MERVLAFINNKLTDSGVNYELGEWKSKVVYPYFVGEYTHTPPLNEDGQETATLKLTGFHRGTVMELETARKTIERTFTYCTGILDDGSAVDVAYAGSLVIPTGDAELKRIEITLEIKKWRTY